MSMLPESDFFYYAGTSGCFTGFPLLHRAKPFIKK